MERPDFLPEGFGTVARHGFNEVLVPHQIAYGPQTIGWWVLGALLLVLFTWAGVVALVRYRRQAYRRAARMELALLRRDFAAGGGKRAPALEALVPLLKRTALGAFARKQVASLSGADWTRFLERTAPGSGFGGAPGEALLELAYRGATRLDEPRGQALFDAAERWIRGHRA